MNQANLDWFKSLPFRGTILDVGSFNVNGSLKSVIPVTVGIDIREGTGVDRVMDACDLVKVYGENYFDNVVSSNAIEHCKDVIGVLTNIFDVCKPGGIIAISGATANKDRHDYPGDYWRFDIATFAGIFYGNEVIQSFRDRISEGIAIRKTLKRLNMPIFNLTALFVGK